MCVKLALKLFYIERKRLIAYLSKKLSDAKLKWSTYDKNFLYVYSNY
jgi:hypothetical protein